MLATLVEEPFSDKEWIFERKLDGERCLVVKNEKQVSLFSRNRKNLNLIYPELVTLFSKQKVKNFVLDGEIVAFEGKQTSFEKLQKRMQCKKGLRKFPVYFYAFDLLCVNRVNLTKLPLLKRKLLLRKKIQFSNQCRFVTHTKTKGIEKFQSACKMGWEGIIAKRADSIYVSKRSRDWLKFKCEQRGKFLIVGYTDPKRSRVGLGALLIGYKKGGKLYYAGKVGTGFDTALLKSLSQKLKKIEIQKPRFENQHIFQPGSHFVTPKYSCKVAFIEWTNQKRLRHPRFLGER